MNKALQELRKKFTISTTLLAAAILFVLFGLFVGVIFVSMTATAYGTLDSVIDDFGGPADDIMGRRCFAFVYSPETGNANVPAVYIEEFAAYGETLSREIAEAAVATKEGKFTCGEMSFIVTSRTVSRDGVGASYTIYAVMDTTPDSRTLASVGMLSALIYLAAVAVTGLAAYLFSSRALAPVGEAFRKQRDLIANASHELKTPLTVISTNLSVMKSEPDSTVAENARWMDAIDAQIQRMNSLIVSMLQLSKMEHDSLPMVEVDFSEIAEGACLAFDAVCFEKGLTFESRISPDIRVMGDRDALDRLITGLLDNATKYCGGENKIGLDLTSDGKHAVLAVMNTGEAVSEEDAKHIFERFYRTDGARANRDGNSFGLGLAIAQATVLKHGGDIKCHGIAGRGTVFVVRIPLAKPDRKSRRRVRGEAPAALTGQVPGENEDTTD